MQENKGRVEIQKSLGRGVMVEVSVDQAYQASGFKADDLDVESPGEVRSENNPQVFV